MEKAVVLAAVVLFLSAIGAAAYAVRHSIARDAALDAAAVQEYGADRSPQAEPDELDAKWSAFWHDRDLEFRCSPLAVWLADGGDAELRAIRVDTAAQFAGLGHDQEHRQDAWCEAHLQELGFADEAAVTAEMERELEAAVNRMVAWTTETAEWELIKS